MTRQAVAARLARRLTSRKCDSAFTVSCLASHLSTNPRRNDRPAQVVSISLAGAAIGSLSGTVLADALGRVRAFAADALPLLAGAALCATAESSTGILAGRFLVGVGIGLASALVPLYISEVAPTQARGTLGSVNQLMICIGILAALVANVVLPVADWRTMFWLSAVPAGLLGAGASRLRCHCVRLCVVARLCNPSGLVNAPPRRGCMPV